jgi:hypothetical protein
VCAVGYTGSASAGFKRLDLLETKTCRFTNLPRRGGPWGEGLTAAEMVKCRWLKPLLVVAIDYLERTAANHLLSIRYS